jgi:regulator of replication initiation timing
MDLGRRVLNASITKFDNDNTTLKNILAKIDELLDRNTTLDVENAKRVSDMLDSILEFTSQTRNAMRLSLDETDKRYNELQALKAKLKERI